MGVQPRPIAGTRAGWTVATGVLGVLAISVVLLATTVLPAPVAGAASTPITVTTAQSKTWGRILVLGNGTTVYRLTADPKNKSACKGGCATIWPPVLLATGQKGPIGKGVSGLGTITRSGGAHQVTYEGVPLYRFIGDHAAGQATGNIKDAWGRWWVVNPANPRVAPTAAHATGGGQAPTTVAGSGAAY